MQSSVTRQPATLQPNRQREHRNAGVGFGFTLFLGRDRGQARSFGEQKVGRHLQEKNAAGGAERRQAHAQDGEKAAPAQREGDKNRRRDDGGRDGRAAALRGGRMRRNGKKDRRHLDRADGNEQRGEGGNGEFEHENAS